MMADYWERRERVLDPLNRFLNAFVYNAANRPEMLPRKPLPKPLPSNLHWN